MLLKYIQTAHIPNFKAIGISIFLLCNGKKQVNVDDVTLHLMQFLAFLIDARKNEWHFWNPETKLDKIGMFLLGNFEISSLT